MVNFHRIHAKDRAIECHMRKAQITYNVLHPGNNKQTELLVIFDLQTIAAIRQYFPEEIDYTSGCW